MGSFRIKRGDIIIALAIPLAALLAFWIFYSGLQKGNRVTVSVNGEEVYSLSLSENAEKNIVTDLGENVIKIENQGVRVISADCPDGICVNHREIFSSGETIVCLPHRLVVKIEEE